jgi:hypothetical protein
MRRLDVSVAEEGFEAGDGGRGLGVEIAPVGVGQVVYGRRRLRVWMWFPGSL